MLRKFTDFSLGNFELVNKKVLNIDGKKMWIFHGDVFDASVQHSKWIAKLGGWGYDLLIQLNVATNWVLEQMGREKYSFSKKIKNSVKKAVKFIGDFEKTAAELAMKNGYDYVVCGHIHQSQIKEIVSENKKTIYMNSGDWIENLTSLEYTNGQWHLYEYNMNTKHSEDALEEDYNLGFEDLQELLHDISPKITAI